MHYNTKLIKSRFCESELLLLFKACNDDEPEVQEVCL